MVGPRVRGLRGVSSVRVGVVLLLLLRLLLHTLAGGGGSGALRGRVYVLVRAGFGSSCDTLAGFCECCCGGCWTGCSASWVMGCRGSGHWGVGGEWPVEGRQIGEFLGLFGNSQLRLPSLLRLFEFGGVGKWRRGCCEGLAFLGVTGMGAREPDCRFIMAGPFICVL